jgi:hypothetical protein
MDSLSKAAKNVKDNRQDDEDQENETAVSQHDASDDGGEMEASEESGSSPPDPRRSMKQLWPDWYKFPMPFTEGTSLRLKATGLLKTKDWKNHALRIQKEVDELEEKIEQAREYRHNPREQLKDHFEANTIEQQQLRKANDAMINLRKYLEDCGIDVEGMLKKIPNCP